MLAPASENRDTCRTRVVKGLVNKQGFKKLQVN